MCDVSLVGCVSYVFFFSSRRRHTRFDCDWSSDVCSSDLFRSSVCRQGTTLSICDLQAKLYGSRPTRIGDSSETTGKALGRVIASRSAQRNKGITQGGGKTAGRLVNVSVENVEKLCSEVDGCVFTKETRFLPQGEILVATSECAGTR